MSTTPAERLHVNPGAGTAIIGSFLLDGAERAFTKFAEPLAKASLRPAAAVGGDQPHEAPRSSLKAHALARCRRAMRRLGLNDLARRLTLTQAAPQQA